MNATNEGSILVTGAAGQLWAAGRTVTGLALERGLPLGGTPLAAASAAAA